MVLFIGEASQSWPYMHEDTCHLSLMQNTKCPLQCMHHIMCFLQCMHHNMCYSYTTPCVRHTPCYLSSHATFYFVKYMLATKQWPYPTTLLVYQTLYGVLSNLQALHGCVDSWLPFIEGG